MPPAGVGVGAGVGVMGGVLAGTPLGVTAWVLPWAWVGWVPPPVETDSLPDPEAPVEEEAPSNWMLPVLEKPWGATFRVWPEPWVVNPPEETSSVRVSQSEAFGMIPMVMLEGMPVPAAYVCTTPPT